MKVLFFLEPLHVRGAAEQFQWIFDPVGVTGASCLPRLWPHVCGRALTEEDLRATRARDDVARLEQRHEALTGSAGVRLLDHARRLPLLYPFYLRAKRWRA